MRFPNLLRPLTSRLGAAVWSACGNSRLRRGDARGAIRAYARALHRRPRSFPALLNMALARLQAREVVEARRYLAHARECHPSRYDRKAAGLLALRGFDLEATCRPTVLRPEPVPQGAGLQRRSVTAASLPFGDCRDIDEYARFRAMPPITPAEIAGLDWENVLGDLLDE